MRCNGIGKGTVTVWRQWQLAKVMISVVVHWPLRILYCDVTPISLGLLIFKNVVTALLSVAWY